MSHSYKVEVVRENEEYFDQLQLMVSQAYWVHYQASIKPTPDKFIALKNKKEDYVCCFGIYFAKEKPLFSERYLENDIQTSLSNLFGLEINRSEIVECGSFASSDPGSGATLLGALPWVLMSLGCSYALVTVTPVVRGLFDSLKIPFTPLIQASTDYLSQQEKDSWGSYYSSNPITGVIDTRQGVINAIEARSGCYAIQTMVVDKKPLLNKVS